MDNEWKQFIPPVDQTAPLGVSLATHDIELLSTPNGWRDLSRVFWCKGFQYRYRPKAAKTTMPTYEQVKLWCETNKQPVPVKPINYEAWRPVLESFRWIAEHPFSYTDKVQVELLVKAFRVGFKLPECMEDINNA